MFGFYTDKNDDIKYFDKNTMKDFFGKKNSDKFREYAQKVDPNGAFW